MLGGRGDADVSPFKLEKTFVDRKAEADEIRRKYPDRIPVICEQSGKNNSLPDLDKRKFLVPASLTVGQLYSVLRQRLNLSPTTAVYIHCNNTLLCASSTLGRLDVDYRDIDGFLYLSYSSLETFGG